jgi:putative SOS response-associated peptidase YedK
MPVIVEKEREVAWIDPDNQNQKELLSILKPYPAEEMTMCVFLKMKDHA